MGYLKGKIALQMFQQYESLGRRYWGPHLWARGYRTQSAEAAAFGERISMVFAPFAFGS